MIVAKRLLQLRKNKGFIQADVAAKIGIGRSSYVKYEKGDVQIPTDMLVKLSDIYNVSVDYLLGKSDLPRPSPTPIAKKEVVANATPEETLQKLGIKDKTAIDIIAQMIRYAKDKDFEVASEVELPTEISATVSSENKKQIYELPLFDYPAPARVGLFVGEGEYELVTVSEKIHSIAHFGVKISGDSMMPKIPNGSIVWVRQQHYVDNGDICIVVIDNEGYCKLKEENRFVSLNAEYPAIEISENEYKISGKVVYIQK
ncbi:MAG: XRE family transcriptional regulator [Defluviitaleaceae bacterium]|nr:XRE family transcriptional regulator [Defluviitaleaceae bacterium]